ncbi:hypothetical protein AVEN_57257-1 [Araneus ventricosus]|uniref:Tc1-like transposase DDE domain-containing protein n=1 Tax=Araneus ventricosus TaxID=182803 RepID=A0A4Y2WXK7_ARAVE|nr:hypothetical protein AVEN_57257-1 [Araneus ventricosus]
MVWGGICASGNTPLVFVDEGVKIKSQSVPPGHSRSCCTSVGQKALRNVNWTFQQDSAPVHKARKDTRVVQGAFSGHDIIISRMATLLARS